MSATKEDLSQGEHGMIYAQEISFPGEQSSFDQFGANNRGGYMPGYGLIQRESFLSRNVTINFFESSGLDEGFFRPWAIAIGTKGLIGNSLKSTINVKQLKQGPKQLSNRRTWRFEEAFPTNVEGFTINYGPQEFTAITVTFAFRNYGPGAGGGGGGGGESSPGFGPG